MKPADGRLALFTSAASDLTSVERIILVCSAECLQKLENHFTAIDLSILIDAAQFWRLEQAILRFDWKRTALLRFLEIFRSLPA